MTSSEQEEFINNTFNGLKTYLNNIKPILYNFTENDRSNLELRDMLLAHKGILETIKSKLDSYKEDVKITIQHINTNLEQFETSGGKRRKRKQTRKKRKSIRN
jgi:hypothetical protein